MSEPRARLLTTASALFYSEGLHSVGIDRILATAGVTRSTLYRHFPGKDDLLVAYLTQADEAIRARMTAARSQDSSPDDIVRTVSRSIADDIQSPGFRGCAFLNAAAEYPDPAHPVHQAVLSHRQWFLDTITELFSATGKPDAELAAQHFVMLRDGAMTAGCLSDPKPICETFFGRFSGWNGAVFHDIDGSVGGVRDSYIVIDNGIADDPEHCQIKPDWNAAVCKGDMGRMQFGAGGAGGRGGPGGPAAGGGRGGPGAPPAAAGPGPGAAGARGGAGGRGGFGGGAPQVFLSRNGRKFTVNGDTTVLAGTEIRAESEAPSLNISLRELDNGSWVIFELPGYSTAATGTAQTSMDALRSASSTSYYRGEGTLWVKLVSNGGGARPGPAGRGGVAPSSILVSR